MSYEELLEKYEKTQLELDNTKLQLTDTTMKYENTKLELENLKRIVFGTKREYTPKQEQIENSIQCSLFDVQNKEEITEEVKKQIIENVEEITVHKRKNKKEKKAGIKRGNLKDIEIEIEKQELDPAEKCPVCGSELEEISKKVVRQVINYIPAKIIITQYVQCTYKCKECGTKESENDKSTFVKTQLPKPLLAHSFASPSLAAEVIYQKYYLGVPLYRQEKMWEEKGLVLPRNMMANWNIKINEYYLEPLYKLMFKKLKQGNELAHVDETKIQCNKEPGRKAESNSYMWVWRSGELEKEKGVIFKYAPSRSGETAKEFLKGYKGILVTDGFAAYNGIEGVTHAECWAHTRRYFYESIPLLENKEKDTSALGYVGLTYCNKLFEIERRIALLSVDEKVKEREKESKPILENFFNWVNSVRKQKITLNSKLNKALTYASNQQKELSAFLEDGRIPLSNSLAERAIRPFAVHRKNWLFADSVAGAKTNAVMYSLVESAKINNLNIGKYIKYLLDVLPQLDNLDDKTLEKYLPWSKELPEDILNFQGAYEELKL